MRILVTGGCGFIGTHLVRKLLHLGHEIIVIDNRSSGNNIIEHVKYHFIDICGNITEIFEDIGCVFHLAAEARIQASIENPNHTFNVNIGGTINVLEACRLCKVPRLINSSSSAVYGLADRFPTKETNLTDCLNPYSASKLAVEELVHCYTKVYGLEAFNLRYFNVFGENSPITGPYSLVIGLFLDQMKRGENLTVVGDGGSLRDFVYVGDVVEANIKAMTAKLETSSEILNIGSGRNISILDIAKIVACDKIIHIPPRQGEAKQTLADISRARRILDWEPKIMIIDWLLDHIAKN